MLRRTSTASLVAPGWNGPAVTRSFPLTSSTGPIGPVRWGTGAGARCDGGAGDGTPTKGAVPMSLSGRVAIVTGGGRGIGRAVSLGLAADGARVAVNFRKDEEAANQTVAAIEAEGGTARAYQGSVASFDEASAMVDRVLADFDHIDILINNAGITNRGTPVAKTPVEELERVMATMAFGSHHMSQLVLPSMREQGRGDIIMISSQSAITADPYGGPYNMAKAAQESLAFTLAKEEARSGIRVNVVVPGLSNTDMGRRLVKAAMKVDEIHELNARFPLGRVCEPEDVANAVRFLVGEAGANITRQRLVVDGGGFT